MSAALQFPTKQTEYLSTPDLAKHIRQTLKARFPRVKFSVRSSSYSMGSSIRVSWTDGPTRKAVEQITGRLEGSSFDGMTDLKSSRHVMLNGKQVLTDYIFCERMLSAAALKRVRDAVGTYYNAPRESWPAIVDDQYRARLEACADSTSPLANAQNERHWSWRQLVWRATENRQEVTR